jgi:hypothetical protein
MIQSKEGENISTTKCSNLQRMENATRIDVSRCGWHFARLAFNVFLTRDNKQKVGRVQ